MPTVIPFGARFAALAFHAGAPSVVGSSGSGPAIAAAISAQSSTVRASGPTVSRVNESGIALARLRRPFVGFSPVTPQKCAGIRIEPPVSEPSAAGTSRAATADPEPDDEPPVIRSGFQGLRTWPVWTLCPVGPNANSTMLSAPTRKAPAASRRATAVDVLGAIQPFRIFEPHSASL